MSAASARPPRRRRSALAAEHPAYPMPVEPPRPAPEPTRPAEPPAQPPAESAPAEPPPADPAPPAPPAEARPVFELEHDQVTEAPPRPRGGTTAEARARKDARNAALGWAAAARKADRRLGEWADQMARARQQGTAPEVLRDYIAEAADKAGLPVEAVPTEVWQAAGLTSPR